LILKTSDEDGEYIETKSILETAVTLSYFLKGNLKKCGRKELIELTFKPKIDFFPFNDALLKVVDSRPARSAGRVKKSCFKTLENFCVGYKGSILSSKVIQFHPVFLADEFSISKNTHNAKFYQNVAKTSFVNLVIVVI